MYTSLKTEGPSINDVMQEGGRGVPFSMTRHDKGGRGGHEVHDIMLGKKLSKTLKERKWK